MPLLAIARREYASFFRIPLGWIVVALFVFLSALFFAFALVPGRPATMRGFFQFWYWLVVIVAPAITMRLFSEEIRVGTLEPLMTSPASDAAVVAGKYLAAVLFVATMLVPTLAFVGVLYWLSSPDPGPIAAGYLGSLLIAMLYLSVGLLASSLTSSQPLAFLAALFALVVIEVSGLAVQVAPVPEWLSTAVYAVAPGPRLADFAKGVVDTGHVVYFLAASFWFCSLAWVGFQSRRWR